MPERSTSTPSAAAAAPHPGSQSMPRWNTAELIEAPRFTWKNWFALLGPGLLMGGAAIGGGEWLVGPIVTAKYGGALLWLATLSILGQVIYNIEISRYTLYTGEPIFTGKFRTLPGPFFWVFVYLLLDFGAIFPYLAANAATPLAAVIVGEVPQPGAVYDYNVLGIEGRISREALIRSLSYLIFLGAMVPLIFGGKIYNALKLLMSFKIVVVLGFLTILAVFWSKPSTWTEILSGFVKFGNVPIRSIEDLNGNGVLDPGEDWDSDDRLDVMEPSLKLKFGTAFRAADATDLDQDGKPDNMTTIEVTQGAETRTVPWPDLDGDGDPDESVTLDLDGDGEPDGTWPLERGPTGAVLVRNQHDKLLSFIDVDGDGTRDGDRVSNMIVAAATGQKLPDIDWSLIAFLSALVAISGAGGLSNTPISNYTRDQGWGMGHHVGAIPSVVGGHGLQLSHVGTVFAPDEQSLPRWRRWYKHVARDQLAVWMPACFLGLALPTMLSVEFLPRGTEADNWTAAAMTANAVRERVGGGVQDPPSDAPEADANPGSPPAFSRLGHAFWFMTLFCGFLVLAPSMASTADGFIRRWVDVFWTASPSLRQLDPKNIRYVYFTVLLAYAGFGLVMLSLQEPTKLLTIATTIYNLALGFSCWHTLAVNVFLLPRELKPNWLVRAGLFAAGAFFIAIATVAAAQTFGLI